MSVKIRNNTNVKKAARHKRKLRSRDSVKGTSEKPRLVVFKSNKNLYIQLVDDVKSATLLSVSTLSESYKGKKGASLESAKTVGKMVAIEAKKVNISKVVFDRNGYLYHGKIKALADAAREGGLAF